MLAETLQYEVVKFLIGCNAKICCGFPPTGASIGVELIAFILIPLVEVLQYVLEFNMFLVPVLRPLIGDCGSKLCVIFLPLVSYGLMGVGLKYWSIVVLVYGDVFCDEFFFLLVTVVQSFSIGCGYFFSCWCLVL